MFELEHSYLLGGSPRRSFRGAKVQRLANMANDIAVGVAVVAAANEDDNVKREEHLLHRGLLILFTRSVWLNPRLIVSGHRTADKF